MALSPSFSAEKTQADDEKIEAKMICMCFDFSSSLTKTDFQKPPIDRVIRSKVVPQFVEFLKKDAFPELQCEAAWTLASIASETSIGTQEMIDKNALPKFITCYALIMLLYVSRYICINAICITHGCLAAVSLWIRCLASLHGDLLSFGSDHGIPDDHISGITCGNYILFLKGDQRVTWSEACNIYGSFCNRLKLAVAVAVTLFIWLRVIRREEYELQEWSKQIELLVLRRTILSYSYCTWLVIWFSNKLVLNCIGFTSLREIWSLALLKICGSFVHIKRVWFCCCRATDKG